MGGNVLTEDPLHSGSVLNLPRARHPFPVTQGMTLASWTRVRLQTPFSSGIGVSTVNNYDIFKVLKMQSLTEDQRCMSVFTLRDHEHFPWEDSLCFLSWVRLLQTVAPTSPSTRKPCPWPDEKAVGA